MTARPDRLHPSFSDEARTAIQPFRLMIKSPTLLRRSRRRAVVVVLPGLGGNDLSTAPLRWYLQRIGHDVDGWGLGLHRPQVTVTLGRFVESLERRVEAAGKPIVLVGWSLGGVVAREAARDRPDLVEQVITFGSPINAVRRRRPIRVPVTTIYSRRDGVVDWRQAIDTDNPSATNIEVDSSHLGLGIDPDVWRLVADAIDHHRDRTRPR